MKKLYRNAPLPFQGQKRLFVNEFIEVFNGLKGKINIVVDLFGGSGLLSHVAKYTLPECRVIYNDFDNYSQRLFYVPETNRLLSEIRPLVRDTPRDKKINENRKALILERVWQAEESGYVDYITLSASLLFAGKYAKAYNDLKKNSFYNVVKKSDYDCHPDEYLEGLEIVSCSYEELYKRFKFIPGVLFVIDPPYLSTDVSSYHSEKYWSLTDYLDVMTVLQGTNYIFFTSNKSSLVELFEWMEKNYKIDNPFSQSETKKHLAHINKQSQYIDMMFYKFLNDKKYEDAF